MTTLKLAVIPGDGIGKEVVPEGLKVLGAVFEGSDIILETTSFDLGADRQHRIGDTLTEDDPEAIKMHDATLLGVIGDPSVPSGAPGRGLLLKLRSALDHYVNLRPSEHYEGVPSPLMAPEGTDFIVVREGIEGLYYGNGGAARAGTLQEIATEVSVNTIFGVERLVRFVFKKANARSTKHLTFVHKRNVLVNTGHLWRCTVEALGAEYPEVCVGYYHVDAVTIYTVSDPQRFDVITINNPLGDILTDETGAATGGTGLSASGNINPEGTSPSMFEPVYDSALDIAGQGKTDPVATIASVALLLDHIGRADLAIKIEATVEPNMAARAHAAVTGAPLERSTSQIGDALVVTLD